MSLNKNKGPLLTSLLNGEGDAIPPEVKARMVMVKTTQEVPIDNEKANIENNVLQDDYVQERTDEVKRTKVERADANDIPVNGKELTREFGGARTDVTGNYSDNGQELEEGLDVLQSSVRDTGVGFFRQTSRAIESWPTLIESEFDTRFGVLFDIEKTVVDAGTRGSVTDLEVVEVKAIDKWRSAQITGRLADLPADQIWYGIRNHSFPDELTEFSLVGSQEIGFQYTIIDGYSGPCRARFTRSFTIGPPTAQPEPTIFHPNSFNSFVEYESTRTHESTNSSSNSSTGSHDSTGFSDSSHDNTSEDTDETSGNSHQSGTHSSSETSESSSTDHTTKNSSHTTGSSSTTTLSDNFSAQVSSGGISQNSSENVTIESDTGTSSYTRTSDYGADNSRDEASLSETIHAAATDETGSRDSDSSSESDSTRDNHTGGESASDTTHSGDSMRSGTSTGTSHNESTDHRDTESTETGFSSSSGSTTGITHFQVSIPRSLHDQITATLGMLSVTLPATDPVGLPHDSWIIVDSQSEHWRFGVWVTELIEVLVP